MGKAALIWTEAAIAALKARVEAGESYDAIGRALRVSRSAVIGKAHRLGLAPRKVGARRPKSEPREAVNRAPLAAGDPRAWAVLNEGLTHPLDWPGIIVVDTSNFAMRYAGWRGAAAKSRAVAL